MAKANGSPRREESDQPLPVESFEASQPQPQARPAETARVAPEPEPKAESFLERPTAPAGPPNTPTTIPVLEQPVSEEVGAVTASGGESLAEVAKRVAAEVDRAEAAKATQATQTAAPSQLPKSESAKRAELASNIRAHRSVGSALLHFVSGDPLKIYKKDLDAINKAEAMAAKLKTPADFQAKTAEFKQRLANGETLEDMRVEAYAVAREACKQATGMRPYDCQIVGGLATDSGRIAEMATGEGKTLMAVMPLYLNALAGKGAHLVTVNDTLAARDAEWMGPAYKLLGVSVGTVLEGMSPDEKRAGYNADITYTTDRTIGFDYLRDRTVRNAAQRVQREPFFALIDEVDEVLIDEARTPLIISAQGEPAADEYRTFSEIVEHLTPGEDFYVDRKQHTAWLSETGLDNVENELALRQAQAAYNQAVQEHGESSAQAVEAKKDIISATKMREAIKAEGAAYKAHQDYLEKKPGWFKRIFNFVTGKKAEGYDKATEAELKAKYESAKEAHQDLKEVAPEYQLYCEDNAGRVRFLDASLKARALFTDEDDYIVENGEVKIVDENKGRTSDGRRYNDGLHQALEAREGVEIKPEQRAVASITYPNLFKKYPRLAGMSGTAATSAGEFEKLYDLSVVQIPTNLQFKTNPADPTAAPRHNRIDEADVIYPTLKAKFDGVVQEAVKNFEEGVPILIGTLSVKANKYVAYQLVKAGVPKDAIQVLNAESVRGDKQAENEIIEKAGISGMVTVATNMAGRGANIKPDLTNYKKMAMAAIDAANGQNKPVVIHMKDAKEAQRLAEWLDNRASYAVADQPQDVLPGPGQVLIRAGHEGPVPDGTTLLDYHDYPTGGLYVIGTERANSRRIDDQLIGRSARQGAPGRSKFFLSLQDDLLRVFGGENLSPLLDLFGDSSKGVQSKLADKLVAQAQSRVEGMHFEVRDNTTKYDEVLNKQRDTFYAYRDSILGPAPGQEGEQADVKGLMLDYAVNSITDEVLEHLPKHRKQTPEDVKKALAEVSEKYNFPLEELNVYDKIKTSELEKQVASYVENKVQSAMGVFEDHGLKLEDGARVGMLTILDANWTDHLEMMEALKDGIQWEAIAGRKPEDAYIERGFEIFKEMITNIERSCTSQLVSELLAGADMIKKGVIKVPEVQRPAPKSGLSQSWTSGDDGKLKAEWKAEGAAAH
ncbi:MAG: hypothetical protein KC910_04190 [Candidatus Eremiobacteraeota bacterium]|nr:hypothetical protein [Candidatus Eremiobacteraeota bacterium]